MHSCLATLMLFVTIGLVLVINHETAPIWVNALVLIFVIATYAYIFMAQQIVFNRRLRRIARRNLRKSNETSILQPSDRGVRKAKNLMI